MTRGEPSVMCRDCGCLDFHSEHDVCAKCRPKALTFQPSVHRPGSSTTGHALSQSSTRPVVLLLGNKRRRPTLGTTSKQKPTMGTYKEQDRPEVIDLISDDDEDVKVAHQATRPDNQVLKARNDDHEPELVSSRVFPNVNFVDTDFPSVNAVATLKKQAVTTKVTVTSSVTGTVLLKEQVLVASPLTPTGRDLAQKSAADATVSRIAIVNNYEAKPVGTRTRHEPAQGKQADAPTTKGLKQSDAAAADAQTEGKEIGEPDERKRQDLLFQARVFDSIDYQASDFVTAFDGLAVARRSHPPASKIMASNDASLTSVGMVAGDQDANDVVEPEKAPTTALGSPSIATPVTKSAVSFPFEPAAPKVPASTHAVVITETSSTTLVITTPAKPPPAAPSASVRHPRIKTPLASVALPSAPVNLPPAPVKLPSAPVNLPPAPVNVPSAPVNLLPAPVNVPPAPVKLPPAPVQLPRASVNLPRVPVNLQPAPVKLPPAPIQLPPAPANLPRAPVNLPRARVNLPPAPPLAVKAPAKVPTAPRTKIPSLPSQARAASSSKVQSIAPASSSPPTLAAAKQNSAASASSALQATPTTAVPATVTPQFSTVANSSATKASCAPMADSDRARANDSVNVLLPKKKCPEEVRRSDELQRREKPSPSGVNDSLNTDGILFVKVNPAPREMTFVKPPVLGYCSSEFLEFMRECGDDDGDEEGDPDEVSRSQLKLLDVVDLTNLSESEDSCAGSPLSIPRVRKFTGRVEQHSLLAHDQVGKEGQFTVYTTANVSEEGTTHVLSLSSERNPTHPERIMCELCEEKGISSRLIRCPTCTKYYHKKCARENGDENICWNCELGSMIDDSELDEEHAKHSSEYLAYLKALRCPSEDGEESEDDIVTENEDEIGDQVTTKDDVQKSNFVEDHHHPFSEESNTKSAGKRWKEFIGDATADIDASYVAITKRIAEELRDDEKRRFYSRGFVSREEFEAQMTEVEEYYINEEARLQQLEREKALEAKKVAEARKAQAEAVQTVIAGCSAIAESPTAMSKPGANATSVLTGPTTTVIAPPSIALENPVTASTAPVAVQSIAEPAAALTPVPASSVPIATIAAAFRATFDNTRAAGLPSSLRNL